MHGMVTHAQVQEPMKKAVTRLLLLFLQTLTSAEPESTTVTPTEDVSTLPGRIFADVTMVTRAMESRAPVSARDERAHNFLREI